MNTCPRCGEQLHRDAIYCSKCGERVRETEEKNRKSREEKADDYAKYALYCVGGQIFNIFLAYSFGFVSRGLRISTWSLWIFGIVLAILGLKSERYKSHAIIALVAETIFGMAILMPA